MMMRSGPKEGSHLTSWLGSYDIKTTTTTTKVTLKSGLGCWPPHSAESKQQLNQSFFLFYLKQKLRKWISPPPNGFLMKTRIQERRVEQTDGQIESSECAYKLPACPCSNNTRERISLSYFMDGGSICKLLLTLDSLKWPNCVDSSTKSDSR